MLKPRWRFTPFVECPNCHKLLSLDCEQCSECREPIPRSYAFLSAGVGIFNTAAYSSAKNIREASRVMVIVIGVTTLAVYGLPDVFLHPRVGTGMPRIFLWGLPLLSAMQLLVIGAWFGRFGRLGVLGDRKYVEVRRELKSDVRLWLAIIAAQLAAMLAFG
jgi:hypothetical protein